MTTGRDRGFACLAALAMAIGAITWAGCGSSGSDASSDDAGVDGGIDGSAPAIDGAADARADRDDASTGDAAPDADPFDDIDAGPWNYIDIAFANADAHAYEGTAFDGRYLYFVPKDSGVVARFDTQKRFRSLASWSFFDTTNVPLVAETDGGAGDHGFVGAIFDGRYVYFVPWSTSVAPNSVVARYDTSVSFESLGAWRLFDLRGVNAGASGFIGGVFDGRHVYFVPNANDNGGSGVVARYDTRAAFDVAASYQAFDLATVDANLRGFFGGTFDGKYVYLVPWIPRNARSGLVTRYDIAAPFATAASWEKFDTTTVDPGAKGFNGSAFDGRYVYLVPGNNDMPDGILTRYDTQAPFATKTSWSTFDVSATKPQAAGFVGAVFDGRSLFLPPFSAVLGMPTDTMLSYDTTTAFGDGGAFTTFPLLSLDIRAKGYGGGGFDGRYVYFSPYGGSVVVRYDTARMPPALPPRLGSFL